MYLSKGELFVEEDDQCHSCSKVMACPLINTISCGLAEFTHEAIKMFDCQLYDEKALKLVKEDLEPDPSTAQLLEFKRREG